MSSEDKINEIHRALVGEPEYGREGIIEKVSRHDHWISNANIRIAGILGGAVVLAAGFNKAWEFFVHNH